MSVTPKWAIGLAVAMVLLLSMSFIRINVATVRLPREDNFLFFCTKIKEGGSILLTYRHSVEKTMVQGRFEVGPGPALLAVETKMASVGTGLPNTAKDKTRREKGWIVVDEGKKNIGGFDFFLSPVNETRLLFDGLPVPIEKLKPGSVIRIDVEKLFWWQWMFRQYLNPNPN